MSKVTIHEKSKNQGNGTVMIYAKSKKGKRRATDHALDQLLNSVSMDDEAAPGAIDDLAFDEAIDDPACDEEYEYVPRAKPYRNCQCQGLEQCIIS